MKIKNVLYGMLIMILISAGSVSACNGAKVQFFNGNVLTYTNALYLNFKLVNTGVQPIALSHAKMRYYFNNDSTIANSFACDYATVGNSTVTGKIVTISDNERYFEVGFTSDAGSLASGASTEIKTRVWKTDWSKFDQSNDYSFNSNMYYNYMNWKKVTLSINGTRYWGAVPGGSFTAMPQPIDTRCCGWAAVSADGVDGTTGGGNATPQTVTTLAQLQELAGDDIARVIVISGTIITGNSSVKVKSNKTIIGENKNATIKGGLDMKDVSNVIIRNLNVQGAGYGYYPADAIAARNSHHLWFDHLNISDAGDGNLDVTKGCNYMTISWCKFWYTDATHPHRFCCLDGNGAEADATDAGKNKATYHHNWFADLVDQRMPRILFGQGHVYNNYYTCSGNTYCTGVGAYASVLVENNYYQNVKSPHVLMYPTARPAYLTAKGNIYDNTTGSKDTGACTPEGYSSVTPFTNPPYSYMPDAAEDIPELVTGFAGPSDLLAPMQSCPAINNF